MEKKVTTKKRSTGKTAEKTVEPFADIVESPPTKKRPIKAEAKAPKTPKAAKRTAAKAVVSAVDPFAEVVEEAGISSKIPAAKATKKKSLTAKTTKAVKARVKKVDLSPSLDATAEIAATELTVEISPVFQALANVTLPDLRRDNRARLQIQAPTRLHFYWSIKENPWAMLRDTFDSDTGSYVLVLKLTDLTRETEQIQSAEASGDYWFDVEPDSTYQAEIGFYAPNRPYFRVVYSNTVTTPRRSPSPHPASDARWTVSANKFAEVLDVAGFSRDAFDVAMAGDNQIVSTSATHRAFASMTGYAIGDLYAVAPEDIRYAMTALASGVELARLRDRVSQSLFTILQSTVGGITRQRAMTALTEHFDIDESEFVEEQLGSAVFGASVVNFPKTLKARKLEPRYNPISSLR